MDSNVYTGIIVGLAAVAQQYLKRRADRIKAETDLKHNEATLSAIKENTNITNTVKNKLDNDTILRPLPGEIIDKMLSMEHVVSPAEVAQILISMKASADATERYAHDNVHRLNNIIQKLMKPGD